MSYDYKLNSDGDIDLSGNVSGTEEIKQHILMRLKTGKGGWKYDTTIGHLFTDYILKTYPHDYISFFNSIISELQKVEGVKKVNITNYEIKNINNHQKQLYLYFDILLNNGENISITSDDYVY